MTGNSEENQIESAVAAKGEPARLRLMTLGHLQAILPAFDGSPTRRIPHTYFADTSLYEGKFTRILHPQLEHWHSIISQLGIEQYRRRGRRAFRRVVPLEDRNYTDQEQRLIKHCINFQLSLGMEVQLVFTTDPEFLAHNVDSANLSLVAGFRLVRSPEFWDPAAPSKVDIVANQRVISDLHASFRDLERQPTTFRLWYDKDTFTNARLNNLKAKYGAFLYALQQGRCARTGACLGRSDWDVDHITPRKFGGNNSLINLQAVAHEQNVIDAAQIKDLRYGMKPEELIDHLAFDIHRKLSDRTLVGVALGKINALDYRNL